MILRLIRGRAGATQLETLRSLLAQRLPDGVAIPDGPVRNHLGVQPIDDGVRVLMASCWSSPEAAATGDVLGLSPLRIAEDAGLTDLEIAVFEVDQAVVRDDAGPPMALRVATGRFSRPGADIEMLNLLRERVPLVEDAMSTAYICRRITDAGIEVSFVSVWQRAPAGFALDQMLWPDIALRYDGFSVEVYPPDGALEPVG